MIERASLSSEESQSLIDENERVFFKSGFDIFRSHNGFRPGCIHLLIGMPSGGKSTFRNSIICDFISGNEDKKILLHLSEESLKDLKTDLSRNMELAKYFENVFVFSELSQSFSSQDFYIDLFSENIIKSECDIVICDNLTTSKMYGSSFKQNEKLCSSIKSITTSLNIPLIAIAHTGSGIKYGHKGFIDMNDIRGSKTLTNIAEYQYILQSFEIKKNIFNTIRTVKHRGHNVENKIFGLAFDSSKRLYKGTVPLEFEDFKKLYQKQNDLTKK